MPDAYILNKLPLYYGSYIETFAEMLVAAGWTYKSSGDGSSAYSATGKVFTHDYSGALGWSNPGAWVRLQDPGGGREIVVQHPNTGTIRIKISTSAKFIGGTPSATTTPSATDERYLRGSSSSYGTFFSTSGVYPRFQGRANSAPPYGFWFAGASTTTNIPQPGLMLDPVSGAAPEDPDPVVWHVADTQAWRVGGLTSATFAMAAATFTVSGASNQGSWAHMDAAKTQFVHVMPGYCYAGGGRNGNVACGTDGFSIQAAGLANNPFNGKQEGLPVPWLRPTVTSLAAPLGLKGWSTMMRWTTVPRINFVDTLDNRNWICVGNVWLPWDGVTAPIIQ